MAGISTLLSKDVFKCYSSRLINVELLGPSIITLHLKSSLLTVDNTLLDLVLTDESNTFVRRGSFELCDALPTRIWLRQEKAARQGCVINNQLPVVCLYVTRGKKRARLIN